MYVIEALKKFNKIQKLVQREMPLNTNNTKAIQQADMVVNNLKGLNKR